MRFFNLSIYVIPKTTQWGIFLQIGLVFPALLNAGFTATGHADIGMVFNAISQVFWTYYSYKVYRQDATQWGMFLLINTTSIIILYGLCHYWL